MAEPAAYKGGYARVSTPDQKRDAQLDALAQPGHLKTFTDQVSGTTTLRPGWEQLMAYVRPGDMVVITELSRMYRSLAHILEVVRTFEAQGIELVSLREHLDTATATVALFPGDAGRHGTDGAGTESRTHCSRPGRSEGSWPDQWTAAH
jgi:DNA invertase Pin-like site-specific DNA recombinase